MSEEKLKVFREDEVKQHKDAKSTWMIIHDKIYDVTKFLEEHPGGEETIEKIALNVINMTDMYKYIFQQKSLCGGDATESFEDVGHSTDARDLMKEYLVGELHEKDKKHKNIKTSTTLSAPESNSGSNWTGWLIPFGVALAAALLYRFFIAQSAMYPEIFVGDKYL
ncbi:hypothetical protein KUTeg_019242 [Tegillarca granosa]|uniref:Cytochrome b5 n=1 Tax=Tegillarca granosa TaxID=220873 RepID=A0ABQ9EG69_TEGGR|nr:hypothetical protein KUTeg_019242 [Tegillarca granosa]